MRITEGQLRRMVRTIIREGVEVENFLKQFQQNCKDYGDPQEVAAAFKQTAEDAKGGRSPEEMKVIGACAKELGSSIGSMCRNFADNEKGAVQGFKGHMGKAREKDSPTYQSIVDIEGKVKAAAERCFKQMQG